MINPPHFWGMISPSSQHGRCHPPDRTEEGSLVWTVENPHVWLRAGGEHLSTVCSWHRPADRRNRSSVLAFGSFYLSSDSEYGEKTSIERLPIESVPDTFATLYSEHGTGAFSLLDGDFSLVLCDPSSSSLYLVVDKFGCNDLYVRQENQSFFFASQPECLLDGSTQFDPLAVAFLLAQEGFIPAPFTLAAHIKSIGRARFLQITWGRQGLESQTKRYWSSSGSQEIRSGSEANSQFSRLLKSAVNIRLGNETAVLLSGGVDSSVVFNIAASLTGTVRGYSDSEREIEAAKSLAAAFRVPHEAVVLDPADDTLPEELVQCTTSWMNGARLALPLWRRYAQRLRSRLGEGYSVLAGQTADTLADNNFTLPSAGYTLRRLFFSSWFLRSMPLLRRLAPPRDSSVGRSLAHAIRFAAGMRVAHMFESLLDGMTDCERFYAGRLFGYAEFPGLARDYFPMLTPDGFAGVTDWYCATFVRPLTQRLEPSSFYREMIELSMDMVMLHLDSRLLFHIYRLEGGRAQLPFMDARVVNFFGNLPYPSRAIWREPKHVIRAQMRRKGMISPIASSLPSSPNAKPPEELLLDGSIGAFYRELLAGPTFVDRVPGLFELLSKAYLEDQIDSFRKRQPGVNFRFIAKVGTLELWSRALAGKKANALQRATA
jgi:hypothetical protein